MGENLSHPQTEGPGSATDGGNVFMNMKDKSCYYGRNIFHLTMNAKIITTIYHELECGKLSQGLRN